MEADTDSRKARMKAIRARAAWRKHSKITFGTGNDGGGAFWFTPQAVGYDCTHLRWSASNASSRSGSSPHLASLKAFCRSSASLTSSGSLHITMLEGRETRAQSNAEAVPLMSMNPKMRANALIQGHRFAPVANCGAITKTIARLADSIEIGIFHEIDS